jgi:phage gp16-like protein
MAKAKNNLRASLIRKVKTVQRRVLGMSDDAYRGMLNDRYGKDSATKLGIAELKDLCAFMDTLSGQTKQPTDTPKADPQARKIWALWQELHKIGAVRDPREAALNTFIQARCRVKVESYRWLNAYQASDVIEILKAWLDRVEAEEAR